VEEGARAQVKQTKINASRCTNCGYLELYAKIAAAELWRETIMTSRKFKVGLDKPHQSRNIVLCLVTTCLLIAGIPTGVSGADQSAEGKASGVSKSANRSSSTKKPSKQASTTTAKKPIRLRIDVPCRAWTPPNVLPKVVLLCVHGLGLNSASFENFGQRMSKLGIATFAVDVRGFGTWMKLQGKEQVDFNACLADVEQALKVLHTAYPKLPIYILGESMGGAIALRFTAEHPDLVDGLICAVPSGDRFHKTRNELRVAMRMVTGGMGKPMEVGTRVVEDATDDLAVRESWTGDPLNRMALTPKELMQFQRFMNENHDTAKKIEKKPVLMLAGFKDKLVKPQGTIELFNELTTPDKLLVVVGNGEHLIFEESQLTNQVCWVVLGWLKSHVENNPN
jgi:alpha-beta hydrolase superfamily lysophospholipase